MDAADGNSSQRSVAVPVVGPSTQEHGEIGLGITLSRSEFAFGCWFSGNQPCGVQVAAFLKLSRHGKTCSNAKQKSKGCCNPTAVPSTPAMHELLLRDKAPRIVFRFMIWLLSY